MITFVSGPPIYSQATENVVHNRSSVFCLSKSLLALSQDTIRPFLFAHNKESKGGHRD